MSLFSLFRKKSETIDNNFMQGMWVDLDKSTFVFDDENNLTILTVDDRQIDSKYSVTSGGVLSMYTESISKSYKIEITKEKHEKFSKIINLKSVDTNKVIYKMFFCMSYADFSSE